MHRGEENLQASRQHLFGGVATQGFNVGTDEYYATGSVNRPNNVGNVQDDRAVLLLALTECLHRPLFSLFVLRYVAGDSLNSYRLPILIQQPSASLHRQSCSTLGNKLERGTANLRSIPTSCQEALERPPILRSDNLGHIHREQFLPRITQSLHCRVVDGSKISLQVARVDHIDGVFQQVAVASGKHRFPAQPFANLPGLGFYLATQDDNPHRRNQHQDSHQGGKMGFRDQINPEARRQFKRTSTR